MALLSAVPLENETVTEGQTAGRVGGLFVAVVQATGEGGLDMADNLLFEAVLVLEAIGLMLEPSLALRLGDGGWKTTKLLVTVCELGKYKCLPSTVLISPAPKPVRVLLCLGRETPAGATPPWMSTRGAPTDGLLSLRGIRCGVVEAMVADDG